MQRALLDGQPGARRKAQGRAGGHREHGVADDGDALKNVHGLARAANGQVGTDAPGERIRPRGGGDVRVESVIAVEADDREVVSPQAVEVVNLHRARAGAERLPGRQVADGGEVVRFVIEPETRKAEQRRRVVTVPRHEGRSRTHGLHLHQHRRRRGTRQAEAQWRDRRRTVARDVHGGNRGIVRLVQRQAVIGELARSGADPRHRGTTRDGSEIARGEENAEAIEVRRRGVTGPTHRRRGTIRGRERKRRVRRRCHVHAQWQHVGQRQLSASEVAGQRHEDFVGAIHAGREGDRRRREGVIGDRHGTPRSAGGHDRLRAAGRIGEDDQRREVGVHRPIELQAQLEIRRGRDGLREVDGDVGDERQDAQRVVVRDELEVRRVECGESLVEAGGAGEERPVGPPLVEVVKIRRVGDAGRRAEGKGLAVGVGARTGQRRQVRGRGRDSDEVERVRLGIIRDHEAVARHDVGQVRDETDHAAVFRPVGEGVTKVRIGRQHVGRAVEERPLPAHGAASGRIIRSGKLITRQREVGDEHTVPRQYEGVVGFGALERRAFRPVHEQIRQHVRVRLGRHGDDRAGRKRAGTSERGRARRVGLHRDGVKLGDRKIRRGRVQFRAGVTRGIELVEVVLRVGSNFDAVIARVRHGERLQPRQRRVGGQAAGDRQFRVHRHRARREVAHDEAFLESGGRGQVAAIGRVPGGGVNAAAVRAGQGQALDLQVGIRRARHVEGGARHGRVVGLEHKFVDRVAGVGLDDDVVIAADAVGQRRGVGNGVAVARIEGAVVGEQTERNVVGIAERGIERQGDAVEPVGPRRGQRTDVLHDEGVGDRLAALEAGSGGQIDGDDLEVRERDGARGHDLRVEQVGRRRAARAFAAAHQRVVSAGCRDGHFRHAVGGAAARRLGLISVRGVIDADDRHERTAGGQAGAEENRRAVGDGAEVDVIQVRHRPHHAGQAAKPRVAADGQRQGGGRAERIVVFTFRLQRARRRKHAQPVLAVVAVIVRHPHRVVAVRWQSDRRRLAAARVFGIEVQDACAVGLEHFVTQLAAGRIAGHVHDQDEPIARTAAETPVVRVAVVGQVAASATELDTGRVFRLRERRGGARRIVVAVFQNEARHVADGEEAFKRRREVVAETITQRNGDAEAVIARLQRSIRQREVQPQAAAVSGERQPINFIVAGVEESVRAGGTQIEPIEPVGRVRVQRVRQAVAVRVGPAHFDDAAVAGRNPFIVPPTVGNKDGVVLIAGVVGLAGVPVRVTKWFAAGPDETAFKALVVQANPDRAKTAEVVAHPGIFGGVIDRHEVAAQSARLVFNVEPGRARIRNHVGVTAVEKPLAIERVEGRVEVLAEV